MASKTLRTTMNEFKPMIKMVTEAIDQAQSLIVYCDYIANTIKHALPPAGVQTSTVINDLHPHGYMASTKKVVEAEYLGKRYKITVEEV